MGFPGSRFMLFHRMVLLPPLVLLTLTCLYTSSTLGPFSPGGASSRPSFSQDLQCFSCDNSASGSRSFLSLANFPATSYIKDVVLRQNVLKVEDSREETSTEPVPRLDPNEVERVDGPALEDAVSRIRNGEASHSTAAQEATPTEGNDRREVIVAPVEKNENGISHPAASGTERSAPAATDTPGHDDLQGENRYLKTGNIRTADEHDKTSEAADPLRGTPAMPPPPPPRTEFVKYTWANMSNELRRAGLAVEKLMDSIVTTGLPARDENSSLGSKVDKNVVLRGSAPQGTPLQERATCQGRRVFVYDLPAKFNIDLVGQCSNLLRWFDFCEYFMNEGMGKVLPTNELNDRGEKVLVPDGSWYLTHQYALELIFRARLKHYPCLTTDADAADLFFVPYYAGLDVIRWHFKANVTNEQRDGLTLELMKWLEGQDTWTRNKGVDHVLILGKISWDFRRGDGNSSHWGSRLLRIPSMAYPTKVLIERDPWHQNDVGVPHPTFFHPKSNEEIRTWLAHVEQSERRHLVSFAGMPRPNMHWNVRGHLIQQCLDHPDDCFLLRCVKNLCMRPDSTMNLFLHSHFCMQPPGDSPTRRSVFDSLVGGCIPVLFDPYTAYYQYPWHLPQNASSFSVFIPSSHVMKGNADIIGILKSITPEERNAMRMRIIREIIPGLLYSKPGTTHFDFRDAFDISMEALLNRVAALRAKQAVTR